VAENIRCASILPLSVPGANAYIAAMELFIAAGMLALGGIAAAVSLIRRDGYRRVPTRPQR
jgi:hypothetical protein